VPPFDSISERAFENWIQKEERERERERKKRKSAKREARSSNWRENGNPPHA
jgi:hypothetical protein